jgi:hypothetical protein
VCPFEGCPKPFHVFQPNLIQYSLKPRTPHRTSMQIVLKVTYAALTPSRTVETDAHHGVHGELPNWPECVIFEVLIPLPGCAAAFADPQLRGIRSFEYTNRSAGIRGQRSFNDRSTWRGLRS